MGSDDTVQARSVLRDEHRLALDGYHVDLIPAELDTTLARISLMSGQESFHLEITELDAECPTRDESILVAMLGFMNSGGDPQRLLELAGVVGKLPRIELVDYKVLGAYGHVDWVSYCQHTDGQLFEVRHGLMSEEISQEQLDDIMEVGPNEWFPDTSDHEEKEDDRPAQSMFDRVQTCVSAIAAIEDGSQKAGQGSAG